MPVRTSIDGMKTGSLYVGGGIDRFDHLGVPARAGAQGRSTTARSWAANEVRLRDLDAR